MKRILALLLVLFVLPISAFAVNVSEPGTFPIVDEEITLSVLACINTACDSWKNNTTMLEYEKQTGIKIEWTEVADADIQETVRRSLISGDYPDIVMWGIASPIIQTFANSGDIIPLNDLIENHTVNAKQQLADDPELKKTMTSDDGNIYCLWRVQESPNEVVMEKQFLFMPWFNQYSEATGAGIPETLDEYRAMLEYFRDHDMNGNGDPNDEIPLLGNAQAAHEGGSALNYIMNAFTYYNGNSMYHIDDEGKVVFEANNDDFRAGLSWINKLYEDGLYPEEDFILTLNDYRAIINVSQPEDMIVGLAAAPYYMRAVTQSIYERAYVDFQAIPPLKNYKDESIRQTAQLRDQGAVVTSAFITANCEYPEAAIQWLDYWLGQEGTMKTTWYGVEGRDWEWTDEFEGLDGSKPSIMIKSTLEGKGNTEIPAHTGVPTFVSRELFNKTALDPESNGRTYADYRAAMVYEPYGKYCNIPALVWCADEELTAEFNELRTMITEYVKASYADFIMGKTDIDSDADWQAYLDGLENLGLSRYIEVLTEYYGL